MRSVILVSLLLGGCGSTTPYVGVVHYSDYTVEDDGLDAACVGLKGRERLSWKVGWCENFRRDAFIDNIVQLELEYDFIPRPK